MLSLKLPPARRLLARDGAAQWEPVKPVNGSPVLFRVTAPGKLTEMKGDFLGQDLSFRSSLSCHCWYAIAGVGLATKPGTYTLHVEGKGVGQQTSAMSYTVAVAAAPYPATTLKVPPEFVEPPKETLARIEEDRASKRAYSSVSHCRSRAGQGVFSLLQKLKCPAFLDRRVCSTA